MPKLISSDKGCFLITIIHKMRLSKKSFWVDYSGPERSWSNYQQHGSACAPGLLLDHHEPTWSTLCNHTQEIADQGGLRWIRGTRETMELGDGPGALWSHFYIVLRLFIAYYRLRQLWWKLRLCCWLNHTWHYKEWIILTFSLLKHTNMANLPRINELKLGGIF